MKSNKVLSLLVDTSLSIPTDVIESLKKYPAPQILYFNDNVYCSPYSGEKYITDLESAILTMINNGFNCFTIVSDFYQTKGSVESLLSFLKKEEITINCILTPSKREIKEGIVAAVVPSFINSTFLPIDVEVYSQEPSKSFLEIKVNNTTVERINYKPHIKCDVPVLDNTKRIFLELRLIKNGEVLSKVNFFIKSQKDMKALCILSKTQQNIVFFLKKLMRVKTINDRDIDKLLHFDVYVIANSKVKKIPEKIKKRIIEDIKYRGSNLLILLDTPFYNFKEPFYKLFPCYPVRGGEENTNYIFMFDMSGSMNKVVDEGFSKFDIIIQRFISYVKELEPTLDIQIWGFRDKAFLLYKGKISKFSNLYSSVFKRICKGNTDVINSLQGVMRKLSKEKKYIFIIFSDGNSKYYPFDLNPNIKIYTVGVGKDVNIRFLKKLAKIGKGKFFYVKNFDIKNCMNNIFSSNNFIKIFAVVAGENTILKGIQLEKLKGFITYPWKSKNFSRPLIYDKKRKYVIEVHSFFGTGETIAISSPFNTNNKGIIDMYRSLLGNSLLYLSKKGEEKLPFEIGIYSGILKMATEGDYSVSPSFILKNKIYFFKPSKFSIYKLKIPLEFTGYSKGILKVDNKYCETMMFLRDYPELLSVPSIRIAKLIANSTGGTFLSLKDVAQHRIENLMSGNKMNNQRFFWIFGAVCCILLIMLKKIFCKEY